MRSYSLTFVYNIYTISEKKIPKLVRLSNSTRPQGESADTQCLQAPHASKRSRLYEVKFCDFKKFRALFIRNPGCQG